MAGASRHSPTIPAVTALLHRQIRVDVMRDAPNGSRKRNHERSMVLLLSLLELDRGGCRRADCDGTCNRAGRVRRATAASQGHVAGEPAKCRGGDGEHTVVTGWYLFGLR